MAKASTPTLLSLDQYAYITGQEPRHFNSVICEQFPPRNDVSTLWYQHGWMASGKASREELAVAIAEAEQIIADRLRYWPAPVWVTNEMHDFPHPVGLPDASLLNLQVIPAGYRDYYRLYPRMFLNWERLQAPGRRKITSVVEGAVVEYLDLDSDDFAETAEITIAGVDASTWAAGEIVVVHDTNTAIENRIRFLDITLSDAGLVILGSCAQFVVPNRWDYPVTEEGTVRGLDGDDPDIFLDTVNVYRETASTDGDDYAPVEFLRQDFSAADPPLYAASHGVMQVRNGDNSEVHVIPATWDAAGAAWKAGSLPVRPDLVRCHYLAGLALDANGRMRPMLARAVAALATARISKSLDAYGPPENLIARWQGIPDRPPYAQQVCPWGPQNGAWEAYQIVARELQAPLAVSL